MVTTHLYGDIDFILFCLFTKLCKVLYRFGRMNMAHNVCISLLNRGLLSVKGHMVSVFGFGGHMVCIATTQHSHLSVKIAIDLM